MTCFPLDCALTARALHIDEGVNALFSASHSALFIEFPFVWKLIQGDPCRKNTTGTLFSLLELGVMGLSSRQRHCHQCCVLPCPESLLKAVEDKDASYCHSHVTKGFLFVKGSTRTAKTGRWSTLQGTVALGWKWKLKQ